MVYIFTVALLWFYLSIQRGGLKLQYNAELVQKLYGLHRMDKKHGHR